MCFKFYFVVFSDRITAITGIKEITIVSCQVVYDKTINLEIGIINNTFNIIQVVSLPLITTATCQSSYYGSSVTSNMICAGGEAGKDSCTVRFVLILII